MNDMEIRIVKDTASVEPLTPENALWIMGIVEGMDAYLFHVAEPTEIPLTEAQKAAHEESSKQLQKRLEARMSQMDSKLDPISKIIQAGNAEMADAMPDTVRIMERKRPADIHLTKLRLWVSENLAALGLKPELERPAIDTSTISLWLGELSDSKQNVIFGIENMELYRAGRMTSRDLRDELERVATCIALGNGNELLGLAGELFDDEERIAPEKAPRAVAIIECAMKKSEGNARLISDANSMLADIYEATGQTDKVAAYRQQRVASATARGNAWEIMSVARELRDKPGKLTLEVATELIGLAEAVISKARSFGMLCEAFDLLVETHSKLGNTEAAQTCQQRFLEAVKAAIEKGIPIESNQRSNAYGRAADLCEQTGRPDEAVDFRKQQLEFGDGFGLLDTALAKLKTCGKTIDKETGARLLHFLTKALERIPAEFSERHAVAYRATGEILEALGDKPHAVEYYEYALQKNPKVGVKKRLDALKKSPR
jgi:tetratricopeptide (TPR) repeat protein